MKTLFEQLDIVERGAVACLIGASDEAAFRNYLRDTPGIAEPFTMGDAAQAYLAARLVALRLGQMEAKDGR